MQLRNLTYLTALMIMIGWLLHIGKSVLLPVLIAMIALYILSATMRRVAKIPLLGRLPAVLRGALVLAGFTVIAVLMVSHVINSFTAVAAALPSYEDNLNALVTRAAGLLGVDDEPTWTTIRHATIDRFDIQPYIAPFLLSLRGFGGTTFLVVLYASFFLAERVMMGHKLTLALGDRERGARTLALLSRVNSRVGEYLSVKTVVNAILGLLSYVIMLALGIEFALFWAILIGLLNYIPYIGSLIAVIFPVLLSLAQFGSLAMGTAVAMALTVAQLFVAGFLEPRMMSRAFNLSPFVVLFALAFWSALWGLPGAVLAVPLTSSLVLVLAEIERTRPLAIMLSASGKV